MRKWVFVLPLVALAATVSAQGISGSAHDFSSKGWNSSGQICLPCHTPHNAMASGKGNVLWNHTSSTATYTLYDPGYAQPGPSSKKCLSCHDGTVALDSFGGTTGNTPIAGKARLGTDLSDDHPVGVIYNATAPGYTIPTLTKLVGPGNNMVECDSCHNVHNENGAAKLLRTANTASALCLDCHAK